MIDESSMPSAKPVRSKGSGLSIYGLWGHCANEERGTSLLQRYATLDGQRKH
jgi:hypothetical protein